MSTPLLLLFGLLNIVAFVAMIADKTRSADPKAPRLSEGVIFFMAAIGGGLGVYVGMFAARHKTRKWYFLAGIPLLIIQNAATAYLLYLYLA